MYIKDSTIRCTFSTGIMLLDKINIETIRSDTARFPTRYEAEFRKHFRGSLIKAITSIEFPVGNFNTAWKKHSEPAVSISVE